MLAVGVVVVSKAAAFFEVDQVTSGSVTSVLDYADQQSGQGGSEYEAVRVKSPAQFPNAFLAVLFRPWPWEAGSAQALIASAEGTLLLVLFGGVAAAAWCDCPGTSSRCRTWPTRSTYTIMFVIAFSSIGNFGILTRQRTQVLPMLLVLLVLPAERQRLDEYTPTVEERARTLIRSPARPSPLS